LFNCDKATAQTAQFQAMGVDILSLSLYYSVSPMQINWNPSSYNDFLFAFRKSTCVSCIIFDMYWDNGENLTT